MPRKVGLLAWLNVVLVGVLILGIIFTLKLYPRLNAGQKVVDRLKPAFAPARVTGDTAGINFVSAAINTLDPITTDKGTAASEVPKLVAYVSSQTGLSAATINGVLQAQFPHTLALLQAIPLSSVSAELPAFINFVAGELKVTPAQLVTTLQTSFPHLYQTIANLPIVTAGWDNVPNLNGLTRFNGAPVKSAAQLQQYLSQDVVPVVTNNESNFHRVATYFPPVKDIPILLTVIGLIAVLYGLLMMLRAGTGTVKRGEAQFTWSVVLLLGLIVLGIIFGTQVFPRLDGGSHLLRDARPGFSPARVAGDRAGITFDSHVVDMADPIINPQGGAAAEIQTLLTTIATATKSTPTKLMATISGQFPHTAALLEALPLTSVNSELPGVLSLLHIVLRQSPAEVLTTLQTNVPGLAQAIENLPTVVAGWDNNPGGAGLTRFNGAAVTTTPQLRDYFSNDVIAAVEATGPDFRTLDKVPDLEMFPGILTTLGVLVVVYGIIMLMVVGIEDQETYLRRFSSGASPGVRRAGAS